MAAPKSNLNFTADLVGMIQQAAADGIAGAANGMQAVAAAFGKQVGNKSDLTKAHENIGVRMQQATLDAYDSLDLHGERQRESPSRFKGKLRPALADARQVNATANGIQFVNRNIMAARARHYARLNWGAAGIGYSGGPSRTVPMTLFGSTAGRLSFNEETRPAFQLPPGLFLGANGRYTLPSGERHGGKFVPLGELPRGYLSGRAAAAKNRGDFDKITAGIRARYFLEAGLEQVAEALPQEYNVLVQKWLNEGSKAGKAYLSELDVRGGTGRIKNFSAPSLRVRG